MAYSRELRRDVEREYLETKIVLRKLAEKRGIAYPTIQRWSIEGDWVKKRKKRKTASKLKKVDQEVEVNIGERQNALRDVRRLRRHVASSLLGGL